jgi:hypothetical protein
MYASLMALAVVLTAAGVGMVVFGIPINAFSLGNTLIVSGTTAICGGLILVALAVAYRQLRRIADALTRAGPRVPRPLDLADPYAPGSLRSSGPPTARIPLPREGEAPGAEQRTPDAPYHPESRPAYRTEPEHASELRTEFGTEARQPEWSDHHPERRVDVRRETRFLPREQRAEDRYVQPPARSSPSDYASERQRARSSRNEIGEEPEAVHSAGRAPRLPLPPSIAAVFGPRPSGERAENFGEPEADAAGREDPGQAAPTFEPAAPAAGPESVPEEEPEEANAGAVLKSGVVDGLAYTLYADGSIAAELPEGRRRFASINELRTHLEQSSE